MDDSSYALRRNTALPDKWISGGRGRRDLSEIATSRSQHAWGQVAILSWRLKMAQLEYKPVRELTRVEIVSVLASDDCDRIASALYSATRHDPDWKWVQEQLLRFIEHENIGVRWAAATCLGDLAIFHRTLDRERVVPVLERALLDAEIRDVAEMSLSFVKQFVTV